LRALLRSATAFAASRLTRLPPACSAPAEEIMSRLTG